MPIQDPDHKRLGQDIARRKARDSSDLCADLHARRRAIESEYARSLKRINSALPPLGLAKTQDEAAYKTWVRTHTNGRTDSLTATTAAERRAMIAALAAAQNSGKHRENAAPVLDSAADMRLKVRAMLADQQLPEAYAESILRRQRGLLATPGGHLTACPLDLASAADLRGIIAALHKRAKKAAKT